MLEQIVNEFLKNVSREQALIAAQVYLDLLEVKRYYSVGYKFNNSLNKMILSGRRYKEAPVCEFIPITAYEFMNFAALQKFINAANCEILFLVVITADSTKVYYQIAGGLVPPEDTSDQHYREGRRQQLDRELEKNRKLIEEAALFGTTVELPGILGTTLNTACPSFETPVNMQITESEVPLCEQVLEPVDTNG